MHHDVNPLLAEFALQTRVEPQLPLQNFSRVAIQFDVQIDIAPPRGVVHTGAKQPHLRLLAQQSGGGVSNLQSLLVCKAHGVKSITGK